MVPRRRLVIGELVLQDHGRPEALHAALQIACLAGEDPRGQLRGETEQMGRAVEDDDVIERQGR